MEWIQAHWTDIMAILGGAYALALAIVKLTPTPKDDKAMGDVNVLLKLVAGVFGLDLKQGRTTKPPSIRLPIILLACGLLMTGCTGMSNGQRYKIASNTYSTTLNVLSDMRDAGYMTTADRQTVTALRLTAGVILDQMEQDVIDKKTVDFQYMMETLNTVLDELLRMQIQAEKVKRETLAGKKVTYDDIRGGIDSQGAHCRRGACRWDNRDGHAREARLDPGRSRDGPRDTQGSGGPMGRRRITAPVALADLRAEVEYD